MLACVPSPTHSSNFRRVPIATPGMPPQRGPVPIAVGDQLVVIAWQRTRWGLYLVLRGTATGFCYIVMVRGGFQDLRRDEEPPQQTEDADEGGV